MRKDYKSSTQWALGALAFCSALGCGADAGPAPDDAVSEQDVSQQDVSEPVQTPLELDCRSPAFVPCGGDVVGHWRLEQSCFRGENLLPSVLLPEDCSVDGFTSDIRAAGEILFEDDGSFEYSLGLQGDFALQFSAGCLAPDVGCSTLEDLVPYPGLTCSGVAALGCSCWASVEGENSEVGTFETTEDRIVLIIEGRLEAERVAFCND